MKNRKKEKRQKAVGDEVAQFALKKYLGKMGNIKNKIIDT